MFSIQFYESTGEGHWAQARYMVHGYEEVHWTNDLDEAVYLLKQEILWYERMMIQES